jgi:hypothetical protein
MVTQNRDDKMLETLREYIDSRDSVVEQKIKLWIITSVLVNVVAILPVIFFLGGIYQNANASLELLKKDQSDIAETKRWQADMNIWRFEVDMLLKKDKKKEH